MAKSAIVLSALRAAGKKGAALSWKGARWSARKGYDLSRPAVVAVGRKARADKRVAIGLGGAAAILLLVLGVVTYSMFGKKGQDQAEASVNDAGAVTNSGSFAAAFDTKSEPAKTSAVMPNGSLNPEVLKKVKKSTLFLRVETGNGGVGTGSGFFAFEPGIVLTNAHVVGMLGDRSSAPRKIDAILNSGDKDEKTIAASVLDIDRSSDLAVLRLSGDSDDLPQPLAVNSARELLETQQVFIFGFPFGEMLATNKGNPAITISPSQVSSLRKNEHGELAQIQVNGGMNPGNSGGPVVNAEGNVVGVAVAGIRNTSINFAIPGDSVHSILKGRIKEITYGTPARRGDNIAVPVTVRTIDPLKRIKRVAIDWWLGKAGDNRPATATQPEALSGDTEHQTVYLTYQGDTAQGELVLPASAEGKAYWVQPLFISNTKQSQWSNASVFVPDLVDAKPAMLVVKHQVGQAKMSLKSKTSYKMNSENGGAHTYAHTIDCQMLEATREVDAAGNAQRRLELTKLDITELRDNRPAPRAAEIKDLSQLAFTLTVDSQGNLTQKNIQLNRVAVESMQPIRNLSEKVLVALDANSVTLPGSNVNAGQTWKVNRTIPVETLGSKMSTQIEMTYTYRGVRVRNGRDEAVMAMTGAARGPINAKVHGAAAYDLAFGQIVQATTVLELNFRVRFADDLLHVDGTTELALERTPPDGK